MTSEEIRESIFNTAGGQSPGLDGFPIEFYRSFLPKLIEPLCSMFNYAIETEKLPDTDHSFVKTWERSNALCVV